MSAAPLVSVCIPCYNAEHYVGETLKSVFCQTWRTIEVIIVDDGSIDNSLEVIDRFRCDNLKVISKKNEGQTVALNVCLSHASGDYIQYLDADDLLDPQKIEIQIGRLLDHQDCVASAEWGRFYGDPSDAQFRPELVWRDLDPLDWLALSRADGLGMMFPALWLIPRCLVDQIGPWQSDLTLNNDAEYFTRLILAARKVLFCEGARTYYRSGLPNSLTGVRSSSAITSQAKVLDLCETRVLEAENGERMRRAFALSWQHFAHGCYPYAPDIAEEALRRARRLHPVTIEADGGLTFKFASKFLGWRLARRLQVISGRK